MPFWKGKSSQPEASCFPEGSGSQELSAPSVAVSNDTNSQVSKPFHLMSFEELLEVLPSCSAEAVSDAWLPEMQKKAAAAKQALQAAEQRSLESQATLSDINDNLKAIGQEAGVIAKTYNSAMKSAESILERNESGSRNLLSEARQNLQKSEAECADLRLEAITTQQTFDSLWRVARPAVVFSLSFPEQWSPSESQAIRQVLRDYPGPGEAPVNPTVRVPQNVYFKAMDDLEHAEKAVQDLKGIVTSQSETIEDQSAELDSTLTQLVTASQVIEARDHEILLLDRRAKELDQKASHLENAQRQADHDRAGSEQLIEELKKMAKKADGRVEEQDHALFKMRQDLDRMREQLTMSQTKVRELQGRPAVPALNRNADRMPGSATAFTLGVQQLQRGVGHGAARPQPTYRVVAPSSNLALPQQAEIVSVNSSTLAEPVRGERLPDPFRLSPALQTPPGSHTKTRPPNLVIRRPQDHDKPLPSPPTISPTIPPTALLGRDQPSSHEHADRSTGQLPYISHNYAKAPIVERRLLSSITEASHEATNSARSASATSSDMDAYRTSMNALNRLNNQTSPQQENSPSPGMFAVQRRRELRKVTSEELSVTQLYHHGRTHL